MCETRSLCKDSLHQQGPQTCCMFSEKDHTFFKMNMQEDRGPLRADQAHGLLSYQGFRCYQGKAKLSTQGSVLLHSQTVLLSISKYNVNSREFL